MVTTNHEWCATCGFDGASYDDDALLATLERTREQWRVLLMQAGPELRVRPEPSTWSAIEYAAHSRDITALHVFAVDQALTIDEPVLPEIDGEALIETSAATYRDEHLDAVMTQLDLHTAQLRDLGLGSKDGGWQRGITIGSERVTVRRLLEHGLHDSLHHLDDVERGLRLIRGAGH